MQLSKAGSDEHSGLGRTQGWLHSTAIVKDFPASWRACYGGGLCLLENKFIMEEKYTGSCLCGAIHYEVNGPIGAIVECHCSRCRKANGSAYAVNAPIAKADFKIVQGEKFLKKFQSTAATQRCFCSECGSPIISIKADTPDFYRLRVGTLDTPLQQKPTCHIFAASKAEWDEITDSLPQYAERP